MPITVLDTGDIMVNKTEEDSCPYGACILLKGEREKKEAIRIQTVISATKSITG